MNYHHHHHYVLGLFDSILSTSLTGSSSSNFSGPSFTSKATSSASTSSSTKPQAQAWQSGKGAAAQNKPWMSGSGPAPKPSAASQPGGAQPSKPNYNLNFSSVIGGREERGIRGPGFGKKKKSSRCWRFDCWSFILPLCTRESLAGAA